MSYLNQAQDPRRRATAIITVGAVHALLAAVLITGLTVRFVDRIPIPFTATNVKLDQPKPEPTPTQRPEPEHQTYVAPDPTPPIKLPTDTSTVRDPIDTNVTEVIYYPPGPIDPPAPPLPPRAGFATGRAVPSNNSADWITADDYPRRELVDGREGSVGYRLVIGTRGQVASCEITRPSGILGLDVATCRLISRRARFKPATDESGAKVLGTFAGSVTWQIPG